jgi:hypothetical protein
VQQLLKNYLYFAVHPFRQSEVFGEVRALELEKRRTMSLSLVGSRDDETSKLKKSFAPMSFYELLSCSWLLAVIKTMYFVLSLMIGHYLIRSGTFLKGIKNLDFLRAGEQNQETVLFILLLQLVFFPLGVWIYIKFWKTIIIFFTKLFDKDEGIESIVDEVVEHSLCSHVFLLIPVFGDLARHFSSVIYLYAGCKNNLGLSSIQSLAVIISPIFLLLSFFTSVILSFLIIVMSLF